MDNAAKEHEYDRAMLLEMELNGVTEQEIKIQFEEYVVEYGKCLLHASQRRYFETFQRGLLSNLDRKSGSAENIV